MTRAVHRKAQGTIIVHFLISLLTIILIITLIIIIILILILLLIIIILINILIIILIITLTIMPIPIVGVLGNSGYTLTMGPLLSLNSCCTLDSISVPLFTNQNQTARSK